MQLELKRDPGRARHDVRLRHARPGRGARDVRPDRGHERRPGRADRQPARDLRASRRPPFVADFIGSLNALELTVDELVGGYAVMRLGEGERVVVPAGAGDAGRRRRCASRSAPSRCRSRRPTAAAPDGGSRLEGRSPRSSTSACTRSSTSTRGPAASSPTAWPTSRWPSSRPGSRRRSAWEPEDASVARSSQPSPTRRSSARRPTSAPITTTSEIADHDHRDRDHLRQLAREAERRVEVDRERRAAADDERGDRVLVERGRERDQEGGDDRRQDQRQRDRAERP